MHISALTGVLSLEQGSSPLCLAAAPDRLNIERSLGGGGFCLVGVLCWLGGFVLVFGFFCCCSFSVRGFFSFFFF